MAAAEAAAADAWRWYEKMDSSTRTWQLEARWTKPPRHRAKLPTHPALTGGRGPAPAERWGERLAQLDASARVGLWVALEKVHGANFCFAWVRGEDAVRAAKRGGLLGEGDEFFGYRAAFDAELPRVRELLRGVAAAHEDAERVYVFAELFGGAYPDSDAAPAAADAAAAAAASEEGDEVEAVQQEILYSPSLRFYYFDIAVESRARGKRYLDYCEACALWEAAGVFYAQPLFLGPLHEALALPTEFPTTLPARLGLRELPGNMAEGLVVMPVCEVDVGGGRRAILKRKSPRFEERVRVFAAGSAASPNASDLTTLLTGFVNRNRVAAARSKLGPRVRDADLAAAVATDAIEDACGDEEVAARWKALSDAQRARTRDVLRQVASDVAAAATKGRGGGRR